MSAFLAQGDDLDYTTDRFTISDVNLVVGDHVHLSPGLVIPCDMVLISGRVVVDESMLTGMTMLLIKIIYFFINHYYC
jgi:P-type E1-E2 ATPase